MNKRIHYKHKIIQKKKNLYNNHKTDTSRIGDGSVA